MKKPKPLSVSEKSFQADYIWPHINIVQMYLTRAIELIHERLLTHDFSKLWRPEISTYTEWAHSKNKNKPKLLKKMNEALNLHYEKNPHHPEHFENGINGMGMIDLITWLCDLAVSSHEEDSLLENLEDARKLYNIDEQLFDVILNTANSLKFTSKGEIIGKAKTEPKEE